jgi:integrase
MASRQRYQHGALIKKKRADGHTDWVLRYRVTLPDGSRAQRQAVVGTTEQYRTESQAQKAANEVRVGVNNQQPSAAAPTVRDLAWHFKDRELRDENERRSWSTKTNYKDMIDLWILPRWETTPLMAIKAHEVEAWLESIKSLANPTKQRIRNVFSVMFSHAQRFEFVPVGHNPIKLVRQTGKRSRIPDILDASEIHQLWHYSQPRERAAIAMEFGNGLRVSEGFALRWVDIDFEEATAAVTKGIVKGHLGDVKTEVSKKLVPLHWYQIEALKAWRAVAPYPEDNDWVFGSHRTKGKRPYWPDMVLKRCIRPLAVKLGIKKRIGWHTFRRSYASLLKRNGADVKVVQELLRHANITTTMNLYAQAFSDEARSAQSNVIELMKQTPVKPLPQLEENAVSLIVP